MLKIAAALVRLSVAAAVLSGCAGQSTPPDTRPTAGAAAPASEPSPLPSRDRCNPDQGLHSGGEGVSSSGVLQPQDFADTRDLGPRPGAQGAATLHLDGRPASYVVAPNDGITAVAARFCMTTVELSALNAVRRTNPYGVTPDVIHPGDTLNLDPCTVRTVGDDNGRVNDNDLPVYIPTC